MGEVVDVRPDRFLRAMRDTGDWVKSCEQAGLTTAEVEELCRNPKYDLAVVECQIEHHEDQLIQATEKVIEQARAQRAERVRLLREQAMADFRARHPEAVNG